MNLFRTRNKKYWLTINFLGNDLNAYIYVPSYVPATYDNEESGGIKDFELLKLEYKGESLKNFFEQSNVMLEINELIELEYYKI